MTISAAVRAAIYVRISDDRSGEELGVARQEELCREIAKRNGWDVVLVFKDNDISAHKGKKNRPDYNQLLKAIEADQCDALIIYHADRLHRSVRQLLDFLDIVVEWDKRHKPVSFQIDAVRQGRLDLSTPTGRAVAITVGAWSEQESAHKADRIKDKMAQLAAAGEMTNGGPRPYGFRRIFSDDGPRRRIIRDEIDEFEAKIIRECAERFDNGDSLRSIVADLNQRGIKTSLGNKWSIQSLRWLLQSARIAGLKERYGVVIGPAKWPEIINVEMHERLRARLKRNYSRKTQPLIRKHFLTGMVYCHCQPEEPIKMRVTWDDKKPKYVCPPKTEGGCGGCTVLISGVETVVSKWIIKRAADPKVLRMLADRQESSKSETKAVMESISRRERRLEILREQLTDDGDDEDLVDVVAAVKKLRSEIRDERDKLAKLAGATPLIGLDVAELAERWDSISIDLRRALADFYIDKVTILATDMRGKFDVTRVKVAAA
ncbi:recombinase family protein [Sphaerisporangium sp. NPDC088356]|uniref:recombinase family protein n=1 Tax=Sphaerisporangium sp. NPDC088356 TaxID=3154871 RepID=UPI003413ACCC